MGGGGAEKVAEVSVGGFKVVVPRLVVGLMAEGEQLAGLQGVGGIEGGGLGGVWWGAWLAGLQSGCHGEDGSSMLTQRRRRVEVVMSDMVTGMVNEVGSKRRGTTKGHSREEAVQEEAESERSDPTYISGDQGRR